RDFHVTGVQTCALPICRMRIEGAGTVRGSVEGGGLYRELRIREPAPQAAQPAPAPAPATTAPAVTPSATPPSTTAPSAPPATTEIGRASCRATGETTRA